MAPRALALALLLLLIAAPTHAEIASVEDAFSPHQGATQLVLDVIGGARRSVHVAAYALTSRPIGAALIAAKRRGVDVKVVLDDTQNGRYSLAGFLNTHGVPTRINSRYALMHDKFIVVDGDTLELGSFNYTKAAEERNAENVLVLRGAPRVAADYARQWDKLWDEGE